MKSTRPPESNDLVHIIVPFGEDFAGPQFEDDCPHCLELAELERLGIVKPDHLPFTWREEDVSRENEKN